MGNTYSLHTHKFSSDTHSSHGYRTHMDESSRGNTYSLHISGGTWSLVINGITAIHATNSKTSRHNLHKLFLENGYGETQSIRGTTGTHMQYKKTKDSSSASLEAIILLNLSIK